MKFEAMMSGIRVTDYEIKPLFDTRIVNLIDFTQKVKNPITINFILENFTVFPQGDSWVMVIDYDTMMKISILENYPDYKKEICDYIGEDWLDYYLRFGH